MAAAAAQHVVLDGAERRRGASADGPVDAHDVLVEPLPIASGPRWGAIDQPGLGVEIDEGAVAEAAARYRTDGQYLPWQDDQLAKEER